MYNFIFYYFYKLTIKINSDAIFNAAGMVFLTIIIHLAFSLSILKKVLNLSYTNFRFSDIYLINKIYMMPLGLVFLILIYKIFKKRFNKIQRKYEGRRIVTLGNTIYIFLLMLVPLIISIILLKKN